jgi:Ca-activated chloride channel family protein
MDWHYPQTLYFILPACIGWGVIALRSMAKRTRARSRFVDRQMAGRILPEFSFWRFWTKFILQQIAIIFGLIALAGPQFGDQVEQVVPRGSDLYVLIDVSRSMLADDVAPNRLARAKADVSSLLNKLDGERIGLVAFAGQAVVKCPLTVDYNSFRRSLNELDPNSAPRGGTAIGDAIRKAIEVFSQNSERDQAVLLITDGDDQQSYPLEAAALAAERNVTIFTVGLGDAEQGARVPQKANAATFVEHNGEQVWSKLDGGLLEQIAVKTKGAYVPAGTRSYDLAELYSKYLQGRRGDDSESQTRIRKGEQFQFFLAVALFALLADLWIRPFRRVDTTSTNTLPAPSIKAKSLPVAGGVVIWLSVGFGSLALHAEDSSNAIQDGLKLYSQQQYAEAYDKFAAASAQLEQTRSPKLAVSQFDEACAFHRKGDFDKAQEKYLLAGLSQDRALSTAAHFNLGIMASERARAIAGDQPLTVAKEKRTEILDLLKQSIASYRHCMELDPKHAPSRKNIELTRQWIKYYSDKWAEADRQKRRDEADLLQFLTYIMDTQSSIRETTTKVQPNTSADAIAEIKRVQDELAMELPVLKEKLDQDLRPKPSPNGAAPPTLTPEQSKELDEGIAVLQGWVDRSNELMAAASSNLVPQKTAEAVPNQLKAVNELDRVWDAIVDFRNLLTKEIQNQSKVSEALGPASESTPPSVASTSDEKDETAEPDAPTRNDGAEPETAETNNELENSQKVDWKAVAEDQETALRKATLLALKAEAELSQMESQPATEESDPTAKDPDVGAEPGSNNKVDPEAVKAGLRKAIELAPGAVQAMETALDAMRKKERATAKTQADIALKILKEMQDAQPKQPTQDQNKKDQNQDENKEDSDKDQDNKDDDKQGEDKKDSQDSKDSEQDEKKENGKEKEKEKDESKGKDDKSKKPEDKSKEQPNKNMVSKDRIEEALRKVREREQEKRERDRELKAKVLGRVPVDKDW